VVDVVTDLKQTADCTAIITNVVIIDNFIIIGLRVVLSSSLLLVCVS